MQRSVSEKLAKAEEIDGTARSLIVGASAGAVLGAAVAGELAANLIFPVAGAIIVAAVNLLAYQGAKKRMNASAVQQIGR